MCHNTPAHFFATVQSNVKIFVRHSIPRVKISTFPDVHSTVRCCSRIAQLSGHSVLVDQKRLIGQNECLPASSIFFCNPSGVITGLIHFHWGICKRGLFQPAQLHAGGLCLLYEFFCRLLEGRSIPFSFKYCSKSRSISICCCTVIRLPSPRCALH